MLSQQPPLTMSFIKKNHLNFSANFANLGDRMFESVGWVSLPKYSGYAMGYGLETIIGPIEIKHTWSPKPKKDIHGLVLDFYFK
jgi:NTE family protein